MYNRMFQLRRNTVALCNIHQAQEMWPFKYNDSAKLSFAQHGFSQITESVVRNTKAELRLFRSRNPSFVDVHKIMGK